MARTISRDPFAREDLVRKTVTAEPSQGCAWCGNLNGHGSLFQYGTDPDRVVQRTAWHKGLFCSLPCHDTYHG